MDKVTVPKDKLLETMRTNRDAHRGIFEKAQIGFRAAFIDLLDRRAAEARNGGKIILHIGLPEPVDYTEEYNDAIERFEWHTGDEIELTNQEFRQYVLDKWGWEAAFTASTRSYTG